MNSFYGTEKGESRDSGLNGAAAGRARPSPVMCGLLCIAVGLAAFLAYWPFRQAYFRHDDFRWLRVAREWDAGARPLAFGDAGATPLYNLYFFALYKRFGLNAQPYMLSLAAVHAVAAIETTLLLWLLTRCLSAAAAGGLFFAWLFSHQEAVAWPAGGLHVYAAVPLLMAVILWIVYRGGKRWALSLSMLLAAAALLTKDSATAFLPLLLALDFLFFPQAPRRPLFWQLLPYLALALWRIAYPPLHEPMPPGSPDYRFGGHIVSNLILVPPQMALPDLRFENYARLLERIWTPPLARLIANGSVVVLANATLLAAYAFRRGSALVRVGLLWAYLGFLPELPFSYDFARAPRYGYIPSVGLALLVGLAAKWALAYAPRRRVRSAIYLSMLALYLGLSLGLLGLAAHHRIRDSHIRQEIIRAVLQHYPHPAPGQPIYLLGLSTPFGDLADAIPLFFDTPVRCFVSRRPAPGAIVFEFDISETAARLRRFQISSPLRPQARQ